MKLSTKLLSATGLALSLVGTTANAGAVINNWLFNPLGTGSPTALEINEYLDVAGNAFIKLDNTGPSSFTFTEHAVFKITQADTLHDFSDYFPGAHVTATFDAVGSGNFSGAFTFASGTIKLYENPASVYGLATADPSNYYGANQGTQFATFTVTPGGGGNVDGTGNPTGNGQITVLAKASTPGGLTPGYFFRAGGSDLSAEDILSFAFTNANTIGSPTATMVSEIVCKYAGFTGDGCGSGTYKNVGGDHFYVQDSGSFKLAEVPEPTSIALFGIAMLGAGLASRKRKA